MHAPKSLADRRSDRSASARFYTLSNIGRRGSVVIRQPRAIHVLYMSDTRMT